MQSTFLTDGMLCRWEGTTRVTRSCSRACWWSYRSCGTSEPNTPPTSTGSALTGNFSGSRHSSPRYLTFQSVKKISNESVSTPAIYTVICSIADSGFESRHKHLNMTMHYKTCSFHSQASEREKKRKGTKKRYFIHYTGLEEKHLTKFLYSLA